MGRNDEKLTCMARSFDLKNACRQCALHPDSMKFSYIVVGDPISRSLQVFRLKALPCGRVKSVRRFLRAAHSLWSIMTWLFKVIMINYFDDFVAIAAQPRLKLTNIVKAVFRLLGWRFAEGDCKDLPFASTWTALGVSFDGSLLHDGLAQVDNTENRKHEFGSGHRWCGGDHCAEDA